MNRDTIHQRSSGTVRFSYMPHNDAYLVGARVYSDLFVDILRETVPPHLRHKPSRRSQAWWVDHHAAPGLADSLESAGYRVVGAPKLDHMHIAGLGCAPCEERQEIVWARILLERAGRRYRDVVFTSLLRILESREARQLADAYDEVA